jgi:hypothetical protein
LLVGKLLPASVREGCWKHFVKLPDGCQDRVSYKNRVAVFLIWYDPDSRWRGGSSRLGPAMAITVAVLELCIHQIRRIVLVIGPY